VAVLAVGGIAGEGAVAHRQCAAVVDGAAVTVAVLAVGGIAGEGAVAHRQCAVVVDPAAGTKTATITAIGNCEPDDANRRGEGNLQDAVVAPRVTPHGQLIPPRPFDADAVGQVGQGSGQVDGAGDAEGDRVAVNGLREGVAQAAVQPRTH